MSTKKTASTASTASIDGPVLVYEGPDGTQRFPVTRRPMLIGRGAGADVRLGDLSLSARHCSLEPSGSGWKVVDLGSRNGTFVNDVLVKQRKLGDGDRVRLGRAQFRFMLRGEEADPVTQLRELLTDAFRRRGEPGLRELADEFAQTASRHEAPGILVGNDELRALHNLQEVMSAMVVTGRPGDTFEMIVDTLIELTGAERGFFILKKKKGRGKGKRGVRRVMAARNFDKEEIRDALAKVSKTIEREVMDKGTPIIVNDAPYDERYGGSDSIVDMRLRSVLAAPVRGDQGAVGTIYLDNRFERGVFQERQLPFIAMFADFAAVALQNAMLHASNEKRLEELTTAKSEVEELNRILSERVAQTSAELMEVKEHVLRDLDQAPLKYSYTNIIGKSRRMRDVFHLLDKVTDSDVPVLIHGESGTGKELVARAIHFNGPRKSAPFISENCAAIPETLLESELFGYQKGSFTGATADKKGLFEAANGGTLFLDEIGDMPMDMQKKLLRVLQESEVRRVGGSRTIPIDVRIVAASNQDLRKLCEEGRFREDLYYRLNVITVELPPLRDRREDIPLLVEHFITELTPDADQKTVSEDAMKTLERHHWPGNVRELRNEIQRAAALSDRVIVPLVLSEAVRGREDDAPAAVADLGEKPLREMVKEVTEGLERQVIQEALNRCRGRKAQAARMLGVSRPTLDSKIDNYGLVVNRR
ncbi:MAG: sigma 54-interacting transcriptional regulator [Planctomycetota bacterium]|nr:sigma 54-interacting transcriptional regulator [Planctomycetota bacterium]